MSRSLSPLVVVGDALLDVDLCGVASRLAPDAPVPVLDDPVEHLRPGGAALAAVLAARAGSRPVVLVASVGEDDDGARLAGLLVRHGVALVDLPGSGATTVKRRVRADGQTLARLDSGGRVPDRWTEEADAALAGAAAVLVSDYGRGVAGVGAAALGGLRRRPVVWDPHPRGGPPAPGTLLATPNLTEATEATEATGATDGRGADPRGGLHDAARRADRLVAAWGVGAVAITLGRRGALLSQGTGSPAVFPAPAARSDDPCGAGDCFASTAALALADGAVVSEAVQAAVHAAAAFVDAGGASGLGDLATAPRTAGASDDDAACEHTGGHTGGEDAASVVARVRAAGGTVVATGGCFDLLHAGHVATLEAARSLGDCLVVCLNSDESVRRLKGDPRPLSPAADRARVLAALGAVDAVAVFEEDTPEAVLDRVRPDIWVKGGDYAGAELPEAALLAGWGGQAVVVPYLRGRSTTRLVRAASTRTPADPARRSVEA